MELLRPPFCIAARRRLGPMDFAVGVKMGTVSLLKNVTGGVLDSAGKITNSIGKGLAQATLDQKYQAQREGRRQRAR